MIREDHSTPRVSLSLRPGEGRGSNPLAMTAMEIAAHAPWAWPWRIADKQTLIDKVDAWQNRRYKNHAKADWQFTTADARVKLKRLHPTL